MVMKLNWHKTIDKILLNIYSRAAKSKIGRVLCTSGRKCENWYIGVLRGADQFYPMGPTI